MITAMMPKRIGKVMNAIYKGKVIKNPLMRGFKCFNLID
jgi:hypothetical protein